MAHRDEQWPRTADPVRRARSGARAVAIAVVAVVVLLVPFVVLTIAQWGGDDEAAPEADPPEQLDPTPTPQPAPDVVTEDLDGGTLVLRLGDRIAMRLSSDWLWEEPQVSSGAVALTRVDHVADPGYAEWEVEATAGGASDVVVDGGPNCDDEAACPPRTVSFRFDVGG